MCDALAHVLSETKAQRRDATKDHLRPSRDGKALSDDPMRADGDPPRAAALHDVQLEEDAERDLQDQVPL
mgnify:FL=1